jgi:hypothetical protein
LNNPGHYPFLRALSARAGRDASPFTGIRSHGRVSLCWRARGERPRQGCAVGRGVLILDPSIHTHATISGAASPRTAEKLARDAWQPTLSKHLLARRLFTGWRLPLHAGGAPKQESGSFRMAVYEGNILRRGKLKPLDSVAGGSKPGPAPVSKRARFLAREMLVLRETTTATSHLKDARTTVLPVHLSALLRARAGRSDWSAQPASQRRHSLSLSPLLHRGGLGAGWGGAGGRAARADDF